ISVKTHAKCHLTGVYHNNIIVILSPCKERTLFDMNANQFTTTQERIIQAKNGWVMLLSLFGLLIGDIALLIYSVSEHSLVFLVLSVLLVPVTIILLTGFFTLQPNEGRVLILFGAYRGTVRESGFHWGNPFYSNGKASEPGEAQRRTRGRLGRRRHGTRFRWGRK